MKKFVPFVIAAVFILSVVYVSYFGMQVHIYNDKIPAEKITWTGVTTDDRVVHSAEKYSNEKRNAEIAVKYTGTNIDWITLRYEVTPENWTKKEVMVSFETMRAVESNSITQETLDYYWTAENGAYTKPADGGQLPQIIFQKVYLEGIKIYFNKSLIIQPIIKVTVKSADAHRAAASFTVSLVEEVY